MSVTCAGIARTCSIAWQHKLIKPAWKVLPKTAWKACPNLLDFWSISLSSEEDGCWLLWSPGLEEQPRSLIRTPRECAGSGHSFLVCLFIEASFWAFWGQDLFGNQTFGTGDWSREHKECKESKECQIRLKTRLDQMDYWWRGRDDLHDRPVASACCWKAKNMTSMSWKGNCDDKESQLQ